MPLLPRIRTPEGDPRTEAERGRVDHRPRWADVERERNRETEVNPITSPCCAWPRDSKSCRGAADGCNKAHRGLTDAEKLKRDKWEQAKLDAGQSLGYERTAKQANAAAANVSSTG
eukprot:5072849-Pyramimonas_sp.AAC.1